MKKNTFVRLDAHYYVIISHNTSIPTTGHLEFVIGLMGMAYKNLFVKSDFSQMHPSRSWFDCERI